MWREEPREDCIIFGQIEPLDCLPIQNLHITEAEIRDPFQNPHRQKRGTRLTLASPTVACPAMRTFSAR